MSNKGRLFIVSAPSGSGKTSLVQRLMKEVPDLKFSVSYTTREPRLGERDGKEYFFVTEAEFRRMIRESAFFEHAQVHGHYYGTSEAFVVSELAAGNDVILDVDVQGASQAHRKESDALLIFVMPPSLKELRLRLEGRGMDDEGVILNRLAIADEEIKYHKIYQYVIINREIEASLDELKSVVLADRCRTEKRLDQVNEIIRTFKEKS